MRIRKRVDLREPQADFEQLDFAVVSGLEPADDERVFDLLTEYEANDVDEDIDADETSNDRAHPSHRAEDAGITPSWVIATGNRPLLTHDQEIRLAKRIKAGDAKAKEELVGANVRLVASVARRYMGRGLPIEDLMQEGLIGLLRAADKYDWKRGFRFSTYSTFWIRQAISRAIANQGRSIRLPAHVVDAIGRVARARDVLALQLNRAPTRAELAEAAGMPERKLKQLLKSAVQPVSLEARVGADGEAQVGDFLPAGEESSPVAQAFDRALREEVEGVLEALTDRERQVVVLRFGLNEEEPHTLEETGRRLSITRERVRQIEGKALEKLRDPAVKERLKETVH